MKTLIVDDSALARRVLRRTLVASGVVEDDIEEAEDGMQALALLSKRPSDLLFCDLHMPRMDGRALLASLRRSGRLDGMEVVVLSSEAHHMTHAERDAYGVYCVARKPVRPEEIRAIVATFTDGGTNHG